MKSVLIKLGFSKGLYKRLIQFMNSQKKVSLGELRTECGRAGPQDMIKKVLKVVKNNLASVIVYVYFNISLQITRNHIPEKGCFLNTVV